MNIQRGLFSINKKHALWGVLGIGVIPLAFASFPAHASQKADSHLDRVLNSHQLRVCTTGDYTPYTFLDANQHYQGIDVAMVQNLAESLDAQVAWQPTSWSQLMPDMLAGKCDIAVGGISVTLPRQRQAFFSNTLDKDGKIPLVRCEDKQRYQTIEQLNQPSVTLIEPKGGTNEAFAQSKLPKAQLTYSDNISIFDKLKNKQADVMITDASEALYQQKRHPELCALNPHQPLQYGEKAYLLPRDDSTWKSYVDQWLHLAKADGTYQQVIEQWLAAP